MILTSDIYAFFLAIFIALTFTGAGVYLTDELSPANQLHQLYEGHQLTYHEGKYGFYSDGTVDRSITGANYVMTYSLLSPILSVPIYSVVTYFPDASRLAPLIFWIFCFVVLLNWLLENKKYVFGISVIIIIVNILLYKSFDMQNIEVLSIVLTNIILYGLFGMVVWKTIDSIMSNDLYLKMFSWISVISCSSLLFWVGALKDHVIVALLFMIIVYSLIKLNIVNDTKYMLYISISSGLLIWERPELSIVVLPVICLFILYKYKKYFAHPMVMFIVATGLSLLPALANNLIVTGSMTKFPFQAVNQTLGGAHFLSSKNVYDVLFNEMPSYLYGNLSMITIENVIGILIFPLNGGIGVLPILLLPLFIFIFVPYFKKYKNFVMNDSEKILYYFSFAIVIMYLFTSYLGFRLHTESGILPDMRYFSIIYAPLVISSISIISRVYKFNYKIIIKRYIISMMIMMVVFAGLLMFIFNNNGVIYTNNINMVANIMCIFLFGLSVASVVNMIRNNNTDGLSYMIPFLISLPAMWQIFASVLIQKVYAYPMFIPMIHYLKVMIFG